MKVLITGASGFIGSHVTRVLLSAGCEVVAVAVPGDPLWRLHDVLDHLKVVRARLADRAILLQALSGLKPDACFHLAWYAEPGQYLHSPENIAALTTSLNLLTDLMASGCQHIVIAGTCAEYDTTAGYLREDSPTRPTTLYAATKLSLCLIAQQLADAAGVNLAWGRIFYLYGPQEDERRVVPAAIRSLLKGERFPTTAGEQVRDYLHVADVASALGTLAQQGARGVFNISSGMPITLRQLMETIGSIIGHAELIEFGAVPYRHWEPKFVCGDNQRLRDLGWSPRYDLRSGLTQTIDWWRR